ncbi:hypothetical protein IJI94_01495 [Candidatus Saccharibacteria bacterium]|nr:hypothetical protein [Candidatus Saccharibacteria bacterium]
MFDKMNIGDIALALVILSGIEIIIISHLLYKTHKYKLYLMERQKRALAMRRASNAPTFRR